MKKTKTFTVFIPRLYKNDDALFVAVNGKRMLIKKGEPVQVPPEIYEVIRNSERQSASAESFIQSRSREL